MDFDDFQTTFAPSWLGGENGSLWSRSLGIVKDAIGAATRDAVKARFASEAHPSTLVALLEDRGLDPAWRENETSVRARIKAAWATWMLAGTKAGMGKALELAGYTNYEIIEASQDGNLRWWEFYVVVRQPFPWVDTYLADGRWGDAGDWGDGGEWAADVPEADLARLRLIVRKWKPTHAICKFIAVTHSGQTWDADAPPGEWDDAPSATWTDEISYITP